VTDLLGQTIGNCRIEALLGSGGMGRVFRAHHIYLARSQALKVLNDVFANDPNFRERFRREARTLAALDHPNIVKIYESSEDQGRLFLSMELLADGSLRGLLDRRRKEGQPWPLTFGLDLVRQAAVALAFAHGQGVVHRDIKPDNLLLLRQRLADGSSTFQLKVSDFGLAQIADSGGLTASGLTVGTPSYMSPEQCRGGDLDGRSDIYSLGIILYEVVTGYLPFTTKTPSDVVRKHIEEPPRPPRELDPNISPDVEALILRCLAKRPEQRFASADELAAALAALIAPPPPPEPATPASGSVVTPVGFRIKVVDPAGRILRDLALPEGGLSLGRVPGNDIVLDDPTISRSHLRIGRGQTRARATDLGSRGGSLLAGAPMPAYVEQPWAIGQLLQVGPFRLHLEPAAPTRLSVSLPANQAALTLVPGMPMTVSVALLNQGSQPERVSLEVEGLPPGWVRQPGMPLNLEPGATGTVALLVAVPAGPDGLAGEYSVTLRARPASDSSAVGETMARWQVAPLVAARMVITPAEITAAAAGEFTIELINDGNTSARYRLGAYDPAGMLSFSLASEKAEVAPGETARIGLTVSAPRRILGRKRSYTFTVRAETSDLAREATATLTQDGPLLF
jgi:eukaryotic-like serine/threonine-protein kinase